MGPNNVVPVSIVLEVVMIAALSSSTLNIEDLSGISRRSSIIFVDDFYMSITSVFVIVSIAWFIYFKNFDLTKRVRMIRGYQGVILVIAGGLMTWAAFHVRSYGGNSTHNSFELRVVASVLAVTDGCLYFFNPSSKTVSTRRVGRVETSFPSPGDTNRVYVISHDLPGYEPPPSYFDIHPEQRSPRLELPSRQPVSPS